MVLADTLAELQVMLDFCFGPFQVNQAILWKISATVDAINTPALLETSASGYHVTKLKLRRGN